MATSANAHGTRKNQQFLTCFKSTLVHFFSPRFTHSSNRTFLTETNVPKEKGKYFNNWIFESYQTPHHRHRFRLMIGVLVYYLLYIILITKLIITFASFIYIYMYLTNNAFQFKINAYLKPCSPLHFSTSTYTSLCNALEPEWRIYVFHLIEKILSLKLNFVLCFTEKWLQKYGFCFWVFCLWCQQQWEFHQENLWMSHSAETTCPLGLLITSNTSMVALRFSFILTNTRALASNPKEVTCSAISVCKWNWFRGIRLDLSLLFMWVFFLSISFLVVQRNKNKCLADN